MADHKFLFITGLHRSGTSILFKCLRDHPQISGLSGTGAHEDEGQHVQNVFKTARDYGGPGKFGFARDAHLTEDSPLATDQNARRLLAQWSRYWDLARPVLAEKSPPNLIRTRFLQRLFPNAYFIMVTRHPLAVALATKKWSKTSVRALIRHWLRCHRLFEQDLPHLRRVLMLKYEDFVVQPDAALRRAYDFLGVAPAPTRLEVRSSTNERYFAQWARARARKPSGLYLGLVAWTYERQVRHFGYSLRDVRQVNDFAFGPTQTVGKTP